MPYSVISFGKSFFLRAVSWGQSPILPLRDLRKEKIVTHSVLYKRLASGFPACAGQAPRKREALKTIIS